MKFKFPLHIHISTLFLVLILLVSTIIGGVGYKISRDMAQAIASEMILRVGQEISNEMAALVSPAELTISLLSHDQLSTAKNFTERYQRLPLIKEALQSSPALSSIYVGYEDGDFFFLRRLGDERERLAFNAPEAARYMVQAIDHQGQQHIGRFIYLDEMLHELRQDERPDYPASYDPRTRGWFKDAIASYSAIKTAPYLFFSNRKIGMTLAIPAEQAPGNVVGTDILLETLSKNLKDKKVTPGTEIALVNTKGQVMAHEDIASLVTLPATPDAKPSLTPLANFEHSALKIAATLLPQAVENNGSSKSIDVAGEGWQINVSPIALKGGSPLYLVIAIPDRELLAAASELRRTSLTITLIIILLAVPTTWWLARSISNPLRVLHGHAERIRRFDFTDTGSIRSLVKEVDELSLTMDGMKRSIRRFLDTSQAVADENNFDRLMPMLLRETLSAAEARLGVLYLTDNDDLIAMTALDSLGGELGFSRDRLPIAAIGPLLAQAIAQGKTASGPLTIDDIATLGQDIAAGVTSTQFGVAVPLHNRQHHLVGAMLLVRDQPIDEAQLTFVSKLAVSAASSLETRELIKSQKELFEAFIKLIAGAIDAKSPYTGGHCERVPELTKMLARAASAETEGEFQHFRLGEDDWEAVHIAAWLHDCGKVTTPEYVVDKATKLETIYDRIHEVRMRFEVLKRDAQIAYWRGVAEGGDAAGLAAEREAELNGLNDDYAFVAQCNEGGEFMAPDKIERLKRIAARTWVRTLDDRIGISEEERLRKAQTPAPILPAAEPLLCDKPEHIIERRPQDRMPDDNPWGFRMKVPDVLYNRGEVYNLAISRGTLSEEDRYKINEHIVQTLIMLSALPFPKHLRQVPEIAGGHHEKMDGSGYPRCLKGEEMSPVARMMVIADIFEALTAVDRPYKKPKTLSEAIRIMSFMKKDQHLDPALFELFLRSGVYLDYAQRFMKPEQIDHVDIGQYLKAA